MKQICFEWDETKNESNLKKHKVSFFDAQDAFFDPHRVIAVDLEHSNNEKWYFNRSVYVSVRYHSDYWCRILAERT